MGSRPGIIPLPQLHFLITTYYPHTKGYRPPTLQDLQDLESDPQLARYEHVLMYCNLLQWFDDRFWRVFRDQAMKMPASREQIEAAVSDLLRRRSRIAGVILRLEDMFGGELTPVHVPVNVKSQVLPKLNPLVRELLEENSK